MRSLRLTILALSSGIPALLQADATISYTTRIISPTLAPQTIKRVVRLKDNKGMTTEETNTTIFDFARQQVTVFDSASHLYAILSIADYSTASSSAQKSAMPAIAGQMLKSMKVTCDSKPPAPSGDIAGIHSIERDIVCTMMMDMPANLAQMPAMNMKMSIQTWSPADAEFSRVPGLWQLTSFEQAQTLLFNSESNSLMSGIFKPLRDEMAKNSAMQLRSLMEMSMNMGAAGTTALMKTETEVDNISTAPIDDAEFALPAGYTSTSYAELQNALVQSRAQSMRSPTAQAKPIQPAGDARAYVPSLIPVTQTEPELPAGAGKVNSQVRLLVTINAKGSVLAAEALNGPDALRKSAIDAVQQWTYRPILRDGAPVTAYTDATVFFFGGDSPVFSPPERMDDAALARLSNLQQTFPRNEEQIFADAEQDASGRDAEERFSMLPVLAVQALHVGAYDKAKTIATELLAALPQHTSGPESGDAVYNAHMTLGLVALHDNDVPTAKRELLESAGANGSPLLDSFGPNMWLAYELLRKGESGTVLEFLNQCRRFWKDGSPQIDEWSDTIRKGSIPVFGGNLR
jgi:hypothetical protein